jgi:Xaa-Pro aminopeptidase
MRTRCVRVLVVPRPVYHPLWPQSEYVAQCDKRRAFLSGFTGSAGTAVVTQEKALLWTDGRYFSQALRELEAPHWGLMKDRLPETPTIGAWLVDNLPPSSVVGVDPRTASDAQASAWRKTLGDGGISLKPVFDGNPVDDVWGDDRPTRGVKHEWEDPTPRVQVQPEALTGAATAAKIAAVCEAMKNEKVDVLVVSALDEVAWLLNLRGHGLIEYNPVFFGFCLITAAGDTTLFSDSSLLTSKESCEATKGAFAFVGETSPFSSPAEYLASMGVAVRPYEELEETLRAGGMPKVWVDPSTCNLAVTAAVEGGGASIVRKQSPLKLLKAIKTETEIQGFRDCHVRDALAMCRSISRLERALVNEKLTIDEAFVSQHFLMERRGLKGFQDLSFGTIAGSGGNGAIIHYSPPDEGSGQVSLDRMLLVDSGGQYLDGTTDITRTVHFGTPTAHQKRCFTRVLQGHIALATAVFPENTPGVLLDSFARQHLWKDGLDFRHGTGHGVGSFLNVHEGPQSISPRPGSFDTGLKRGMTITDEPGYYEEGEGATGFGIRIEDILCVREAATPHCFGDTVYCNFESFNVVPISPKLVDASIMSKAEIEYLNAYNRRARETLQPLFEESIATLSDGGPTTPSVGTSVRLRAHTAETESATLAWLIRETEPIVAV